MSELRQGVVKQQRRDSRYDLLTALDHLLEGSQLYAKAVQDAVRNGDEVLAEYFSHLERTSRLEAQRARELLAQLSPAPASFTPSRV